MDSPTSRDRPVEATDRAAAALPWRRPTLRHYGTVRGDTAGIDMVGTDAIGNLS
jgi:hypothetical protein